MGLPGKRVPARVTGWQPDGTGVQPNGDCGGDVQDGESFSVRFTNPALPGRLITVAFYPVIYPEWKSREWGVERLVEWLICTDPTDPGGTEVWSDTAVDLVNETAFYHRREAEAEAEAREFAEAGLSRAWTYAWNGAPE